MNLMFLKETCRLAILSAIVTTNKIVKNFSIKKKKKNGLKNL